MEPFMRQIPVSARLPFRSKAQPGRPIGGPRIPVKKEREVAADLPSP
jgi:hypothetical protein